MDCADFQATVYMRLRLFTKINAASIIWAGPFANGVESTTEKTEKTRSCGEIHKMNSLLDGGSQI